VFDLVASHFAASPARSGTNYVGPTGLSRGLRRFTFPFLLLFLVTASLSAAIRLIVVLAIMWAVVIASTDLLAAA
jgi:hypothetical protein